MGGLPGIEHHSKCQAMSTIGPLKAKQNRVVKRAVRWSLHLALAGCSLRRIAVVVVFAPGPRSAAGHPKGRRASNRMEGPVQTCSARVELFDSASRVAKTLSGRRLRGVGLQLSDESGWDERPSLVVPFSGKEASANCYLFVWFYHIRCSAMLPAFRGVP